MLNPLDPYFLKQCKKKITNTKFVATEEDKKFIRELQKDMEIIDRPFRKAAKSLSNKNKTDQFTKNKKDIILRRHFK